MHTLLLFTIIHNVLCFIVGKSLCFQLPCAADEKGITVVVTPLIALMENQVTHARYASQKVLILGYISFR